MLITLFSTLVLLNAAPQLQNGRFPFSLDTCSSLLSMPVMTGSEANHERRIVSDYYDPNFDYYRLKAKYEKWALYRASPVSSAPNSFLIKVYRNTEMAKDAEKMQLQLQSLLQSFPDLKVLRIIKRDGKRLYLADVHGQSIDQIIQDETLLPKNDRHTVTAVYAETLKKLATYLKHEKTISNLNVSTGRSRNPGQALSFNHQKDLSLYSYKINSGGIILSRDKTMTIVDF